jgi:hypothetical protein
MFGRKGCSVGKDVRYERKRSIGQVVPGDEKRNI